MTYGGLITGISKKSYGKFIKLYSYKVLNKEHWV